MNWRERWHRFWHKPKTLSGQLTRSLVLSVGAVWLACVVGVVWYADIEIDRNFDNELIEVSHRMFDIALGAYDAAGPSTARPVIVEPPASYQDAAVPFQILDARSHAIVRSANTPAETFAGVPLQPGFFETNDWRIFTVHHPTRDVYLQVADPLDERSEAVHHTLFGLMVPLVAVLPLLALMLRTIAQQELRVLRELSAEIAQRGGDQLGPIGMQGLPRELQFVADHVNHLLGRLANALDVERALAANAAHELRTPLAAARLRLATAIDAPADEGSREHVRSALRSLETLAQRAEKLLQLSRAESGGALGRSAVDLPTVAAAVADEFWGSNERDRLSLTIAEGDIQPALGDADAIAIALRNLVENALRHADGARVTIEVRAPATLVVRDAGPGAPPDKLSTLARRHVRDARNSTGYGLGLSIVGTIVGRHGGQLELVSPPEGFEHGLEARMVLPAA